MAISPYQFTCDRLVAASSMDKASVQQIVKRALNKAGFGISEVKPSQMAAVLRMIMPLALAGKGIANEVETCEGIARELLKMKAEESSNSPENVFKRLGRD
jgi:hypothetical protein